MLSGSQHLEGVVDVTGPQGCALPGLSWIEPNLGVAQGGGCEPGRSDAAEPEAASREAEPSLLHPAPRPSPRALRASTRAKSTASTALLPPLAF